MTLLAPAETATVPPHSHTWSTESSHTTSEGQVRYLRCAACGSRCVELVLRPPASDGIRSRDIPQR